jgi:hypothetical protein
MKPHNHWTGKGKHWDIPDQEIGAAGIRRVNENQWFRDQREFMLWLAASDAGRDLLMIPKEYGRIVSVRKNSITADEGGGIMRADFRTGAKWGNIARSRWQDVRDAYRVYERERFRVARWRPSLMPVAPSWQFAYTTSTYYPDPHTETTTVDGTVRNDARVSWATIHDATTTTNTDGLGGAFPSETVSAYPGTCTYSYTANGRRIVGRAFLLFDTSAIPDTDTISEATLSVYVTATEDSDNDGDDWINVVQSSPASNTDLVGDDFDQCGSVSNPTEGATRKELTGYSINAYSDYALNSTGRSWISKTGVTKLGMREGHDCINSAMSISSGANDIRNRFADYTGTSNDPKLVVTYAAGGWTNIKTVNGLAAASVKTVNGIAVASVKSVDGLT